MKDCIRTKSTINFWSLDLFIGNVTSDAGTSKGSKEEDESLMLFGSLKKLLLVVNASFKNKLNTAIEGFSSLNEK